MISRLCAVLVTSLCVSEVGAHASLDYADHLFGGQDFFRSITVYKEIAYETSDPALRNYCLTRISKAYYESGRFKGSIAVLNELLEQPELSEMSRVRAGLFLGMNYYRLGMHWDAQHYFESARSTDETGFAKLYLALLEVENGNWKQASGAFEDVYRHSNGTSVGLVARELSDLTLQGESLPYKSPAVAALLSLVIPGTGQVYSRHYYDAVQASTFLGAFAFATLAAYRYNKSRDNSHTTTYIGISITGLFYAANVFGAKRTAQYHNLKHRRKLIRSIRNKVQSLNVRSDW